MHGTIDHLVGIGGETRWRAPSVSGHWLKRGEFARPAGTDGGARRVDGVFSTELTG